MILHAQLLQLQIRIGSLITSNKKKWFHQSEILEIYEEIDNITQQIQALTHNQTNNIN